jgi:hypothetical protein|tara:strand:- start:225 stop:428 length:204 start_codon:yes stop_codon:yes gene_type:complete
LHLTQFFKQYTNNINEFIYLFRFLYPKYTLKFYQKKDVLGKQEPNMKEAKKVDTILKDPRAKVDLLD